MGAQAAPRANAPANMTSKLIHSVVVMLPVADPHLPSDHTPVNLRLSVRSTGGRRQRRVPRWVAGHPLYAEMAQTFIAEIVEGDGTPWDKLAAATRAPQYAGKEVHAKATNPTEALRGSWRSQQLAGGGSRAEAAGHREASRAPHSHPSAPLVVSLPGRRASMPTASLQRMRPLSNSPFSRNSRYMSRGLSARERRDGGRHGVSRAGGSPAWPSKTRTAPPTTRRRRRRAL